ncbi:MAG: hypothetical protein KAG94_02700 [Clostridiales bacterium]|nr:hypothetical protein [Clostridiales bacterium]
MKKLVSIILILAFISMISTACVKNKSILGSTSKDMVYTNSYFNFSLTMPNDWHYYTDDERKDLTLSFNEQQQDEKFSDYEQATNVLLMILYRDELIELAENNEHDHDHITPILNPGLVISALKGRDIPDTALQVTVNNFTMYQEDIINEDEMSSVLYYPIGDFIITFRLKYHNEKEALRLMDILFTIDE